MKYEVNYPLRWPVTRPKPPGTKVAAFHSGGRPVTMNDALGRLVTELGRVKADRVVVTHDRSGYPGVAVYFDLLVGINAIRKPHCFSCGIWDRVPDNITAIAKHLEAVRGQLRWGAADVAQMLSGLALGPVERDPPAETLLWWRVMQFKAPPANVDEIRTRFRALARSYHPDSGSTPDAATMTKISIAYEAGLTALGAHP